MVINYVKLLDFNVYAIGNQYYVDYSSRDYEKLLKLKNKIRESEL